MIKRSLLSAFVLVAVFICLISMMCPSQTVGRFVPSGEVLKEYYPQDLFSTSGSLIAWDGTVTVTGANPNIHISGIEQEITTVAINFDEPVSKSFEGLMYYDTGSGLNESEKAYSSAFKGDEWICFVIPASYCYEARIDINLDYKIKSVNVYATEPIVQTNPLENPWWEYVVCAAISIAAFFVVFFLDLKLDFFDAFRNYLKKNKKGILIGVLSIFASVIAAVVAELICGYIFGVSSDGQSFNVYRCIFAFGIIMSLVALVLFSKSVGKKPENLFLCLLLTLGTVMIFAAPFGHISWDVETHYEWALDSSYIGTAYKTQADRYVVNNQDLYWSKENAADNAVNIEKVNSSDDYVISEYKLNKSISHIPSGLFIALARFFGANFYWIYTLGKVPNLLIYALSCYFAMKKLKSGKMIVAIIAFFPTNLFIATNYSYDYWVNALSILGVSYFVSEMQQPEKQISLKENIIMCGSMALACMPKQIYAPILLLPFLLIKKEFKNRKRYYTICVFAFAVLFLMLAARSLSTVSSSGDLRGGTAVSPVEQIKFILSEPFSYAKTLLKFLLSYLSLGGTKEYITNLAYVGYGTGHITMLALFVIAAFTDKNRYDLNNKYLLVKCFNVLLLLGLAALMATALYIDFTPVGSDYISGCQGRYLTPLLLPVMSVIGSGIINNRMNRTLYNYLMLVPCCAVVLSTAAIAFISRLV